jgi:hypothetical protein
MSSRARFGVAILCVSLLVWPASICSSQPPSPGSPQSAALSETIEIDPTAPSRPFPHYWEQMFG